MIERDAERRAAPTAASSQIKFKMLPAAQNHGFIPCSISAIVYAAMNTEEQNLFFLF
jgi:hypothetical protein